MDSNLATLAILESIAGILVLLTVIGLGAVGIYFAYKEKRRK